MTLYEKIIIQQPNKNLLTNDEIDHAIKDIDSKMVNLSTSNLDINKLKGYKRIVVVGNQRSGTTFTAKYLARNLKFRFVDESEFDINDIAAFLKVFQLNTVAQAPALSLYIHKLIGPEDLVVFMVRDWSDILKSIFKKNNSLSDWIYMKTVYIYHLAKWIAFDPDSAGYIIKHVDIYNYSFDSLYKMWHYYQQDRIPNSINLLYDSLSITNEWVPKESRINFGPKETGSKLNALTYEK